MQLPRFIPCPSRCKKIFGKPMRIAHPQRLVEMVVCIDHATVLIREPVSDAVLAVRPSLALDVQFPGFGEIAQPLEIEYVRILEKEGVAKLSLQRVDLHHNLQDLPG